MKPMQVVQPGTVSAQSSEAKPWWRVNLQALPYPLILLGLLLLAAVAVRLYQINTPPLNFHAMRQYHSLLIARGYYYEGLDAIPEWRRQVASVSKQRQGMLEPQINERLVALGYWAAGGEHFWIPRLYSTVYWLIGGILLFLISSRTSGKIAALFATAFYLFLPFGVVASRSFQPDPLMIMASLASIYAWILVYDQPSPRRWWLAGLISAMAILVKLVSAFWILGVYVSIGVATQGIRKFSLNLKTVAALLISLLPAAVFYAYRLYISQASLSIAQGTILPQLLVTLDFWKGWLFQIGEVIGYPFFIAALLGIFLFSPGLPRGLIFGLWAGYLAFCLVFSYAVFIHDYWNLAVVPIASLSLGPLAAAVYHTLYQLRPARIWRAGLGAIFGLALLISLGLSLRKMETRGYEARLRDAEAVGEIVQHSTDNLYLAADYGLSLEYHGELSGKPWPLLSDIEWERLAGERVMPPAERYEKWFANDSPKYFIIFDLQEYEQQADLHQFLDQYFPVLAQNDRYIIFELKEK